MVQGAWLGLCDQRNRWAPESSDLADRADHGVGGNGWTPLDERGGRTRRLALTGRKAGRNEAYVVGPRHRAKHSLENA